MMLAGSLAPQAGRCSDRASRARTRQEVACPSVIMMALPTRQFAKLTACLHPANASYLNGALSGIVGLVWWN
jgi:hypothetical protein